MKSKLLSLISATLLSLNTASASNEVDGPEVRAAVAILKAKSEIAHNYEFCRARAGDYGYRYDYTKYIWELKNRPYIQVAENIFDGLPSSSSNEVKQRWRRSSDMFLSARSSLDNNENGKYCSQYFSRMTTESTPNVSASRVTLAPKLGSREEIRILERNTDMEVGCVKAAYNGDVKQFESIRKACDCQTALIIKKMSNSEVDDYLALVAESKAQDALAFAGKRIELSELQACYSEIQSQ